MMRNVTIVRGGVAAFVMISLAACSQIRSNSTWEHEAGLSLNEGHFAAPTLHNEGVQTGQIKVVSALSRRFASEVNNTVYFKTGSTALSADMRKILDKQAAWIKRNPKARFRVYGHTDSVGSASVNRRLGQRRALAVVNYLSHQGVSKKRLEAVVSEGEHSPAVASNKAEKRNRRVVTEVSGLVAGGNGSDGRYGAEVYSNYIESAVPESGLSNGAVTQVTTGLGSGN